MTEELVTVSGLYKKYPKSLRRSLQYGLNDIFRELVNKRNGTHLRTKEFWALQDVSFSLKRGECLGLIGYNGAGKTTLLKVISGLLKPDKGSVTLRGKVDFLMSVTGGISPMLSGRENVALRARFLGLSPQQFKNVLEEVVEFSELQDFIDSPVAYYSSGMKARLGFAIATISRPDVLILDEVIAVGDLGFRFKCYNRVAEMMQNAAVIFVSHGMSHVKRMCNVACYLEKGKVIHYGRVDKAIELYNGGVNQHKKDKSEAYKPELMPVNYHVGGIKFQPGQELRIGEMISAQIDTSKLGEKASLRIVIKNSTGQGIMDWNSLRSETKYASGGMVVCDLGALDLSPGMYKISVLATSVDGRRLLSHSEPTNFKIEGEFLSGIPVQKFGTWKEGAGV